MIFNHQLELDSHVVSTHYNAPGPSEHRILVSVPAPDIEPSPENNHMLSSNNIPQCDGPNDISLLSDRTDVLESSAVRHNADNEYIRHFSLNQQKQTKRIIDDAELDDFEVTVNNNDANCSIKCSSGFYFQVGKPCFDALDQHTVLNFSNIAITVTETFSFLDVNKYEYGRRLRFSFFTHNENMGGVVVHLHHSRRNIQIQGSQIMGSCKSAVWFAEFLISRFEEQARLKKYQIRNTNEFFRQVQSHPPPNVNNDQTSFMNINVNACRHCNSTFNAKCKPSLCQRCSSYYHKGCIKDHSKVCTGLMPDVTSQRSPVTRYWESQQPSVSLPSHQLTDRNTLSTSAPRIRERAPAPSPNPAAAPVLNENSAATSVNQPCHQKRSHKKQQSPDPETQNLNLEFLKRELSSAQARIVQLDASIEDKDKRIKILRDRIKFLEERDNQAVYDKYFPNDNTNSHSCSSSRHESQNNCMHQCMPCFRPNDGNSLHRDLLVHLKDIRNILDMISSTLSISKNCCGNSLNPSHEISPRMTSDAPSEQVLPVTPSPASQEISLDMSVASIESLILEPVTKNSAQLDLN